MSWTASLGALTSNAEELSYDALDTANLVTATIISQVGAMKLQSERFTTVLSSIDTVLKASVRVKAASRRLTKLSSAVAPEVLKANGSSVQYSVAAESAKTLLQAFGTVLTNDMVRSIYITLTWDFRSTNQKKKHR